MIPPVLSADPPGVHCAGRVGEFDRSGGVHRPAPILPVRAKAPPRRANSVITLGTYLAQAAAHAHSVPRAAGCDTISPRPRTRWSGAISGAVARCWIRAGQAEPTVQDTAHLQRPGDLRVPVMTCDFSWWQV